MKKMISPSMMCADLFRLKEILNDLKNGGIEYLHMDVMDGRFVPNFMLGTDFCQQIRKATDIPLDYHFMTQNPEAVLDWFPIRENDIVSVHAESTCHLQKCLQMIHNKGALAFVVLNPGTPLCFLEEVTDDLDGVLVMTVNPGFAGQKMVPASLDKIKRTRKFLTEHAKPSALIEVDGNVNYENAAKMSKADADIFVVGTSSIFHPDENLSEGIVKMRKILEENV